MPDNLGILLDTNLELRVVFGETKWTIEQILTMGKGTIVELDRSANEPVDIYVDNVLFAKGEVVAVNGSFGVRLTKIIKP